MTMFPLIQLAFLFSLLVHACWSFSVGPEGGTPTSASPTTKLAAATALPLGEPVTTPKEEESKFGVLLLNLGGPETGDDVEGVFQQRVGLLVNVAHTKRLEF